MNVKLILNLFAFCEAVAPLESLKELVKLRVEHFATFEKLVFVQQLQENWEIQNIMWIGLEV